MSTLAHIYPGFSQLQSFAYHIDKRLLEICFRGGEVYQYLNVPSTIYFSLLHAYSPEGYFERHIQSVFNFVDVSIKKIQ